MIVTFGFTQIGDISIIFEACLNRLRFFGSLQLGILFHHDVSIHGTTPKLNLRRRIRYLSLSKSITEKKSWILRLNRLYITYSNRNNLHSFDNSFTNLASSRWFKSMEKRLRLEGYLFLHK